MLSFVFGFVAAAICLTAYYLAITYLTNNHWTLRDDYNTTDFLKSSWWILRSVLYEELIFRGALLYILIKNFLYAVTLTPTVMR